MVQRSREEIRTYLSCPVASTPSFFHQDGSLDFDGLRTFIDFVIAGGSKTILLTYGDSLYSSLTDQEVAEMARVAVEHTAGRALVVAADRIWATPKEVEFAHWARETGVDVLMVLPPDWAGSCTVESLVEHYTAVSQEIPVMLVTNLFINRQAVGLEVMKRLLDVDGVVAIKDDVVGAFARKMCLLVHDRWAVISGGQKQNHLDALPYGCDGYLSTFIKFAPCVTKDYWQAIQKQDWALVRTIIRDIDMPYFDYIAALPGSFDAGIHGTMALAGIGERWRRKPYYSLSDAEMERLKQFLATHKWL